MIVLFALILLAWILEGFFSGSETAFISVNFLKLTHLVEKEDRRAMQVHGLLKKPERLLITTLIGTNLSVVISSTCATFLFARFYEAYSVPLAVLCMTPISFVFCQLLPKTICRGRANQVVMEVARPLVIIEKIFWPLVSFFSFFAGAMARLVNPKGLKRNPFLTKDEIKLLIKDISREGVLETHEKEAIDRIFDLTLIKAADVMIPSGSVISVDIYDDVRVVKDKCRAHHFTRYPVFEDKDLKGLINIFDIFFRMDEEASVASKNELVSPVAAPASSKDWRSLIRMILRVGHDESLDQVFSKMQPKKETMAAVFNGEEMIGILTMEDLMEDVASRLSSSAKR